MPQPELISPRATADLLQVSVWTVYRMIERGDLNAVRWSSSERSRLLITRHQVETMLSTVRHQASA